MSALSVEAQDHQASISTQEDTNTYTESTNDTSSGTFIGLCADDPNNRGAVLHQMIYPSSPSYTLRYKLKRQVEDKTPSFFIKPLCINFEKEKLPQGWQRHVHPEGLPYFFFLPTEDCPFRIITDEWLYDPKTASLIEGFIQDIRNAISDHNVVIHAESDLVLELMETEDSLMHCGYYFVYHPERLIYWLEDVEIEYQCKMVSEVRGDLNGYQARACLEIEYWTYWDNFPNLQKTTDDVHEVVVDTLVSAMTGGSLLLDLGDEFKKGITDNMLNVVRVAKDCRTSNWHIGRFMKHIIQDRLRNYHGAWGARLNRDQSVLKSTKPEGRSKFMEILSPFLFFIPHAQLERVKPLVVDRCVVLIHWERFFGELQEEWHQSTMLATIMLAANCAFLAIPLFQGPNPPEPDAHSSPEQVASYLSLASSLFGLMLGMVMYRQHKVRRPSTPTEILEHIFNQSKSGDAPKHRLAHLVLIWSLPHALVTWSVVAFLLAFLMMCFIGTYTATKILVALSTSLFGSLMFYYIVRFGSGKELRQIWFGRVSGGIRTVRSLIHWPRKGKAVQKNAESEPPGHAMVEVVIPSDMNN